MGDLLLMVEEFMMYAEDIVAIEEE